MKIILAKKIEMSQLYNEQGEIIPVTIVKAGPIKITQLKTKEKDGYQAVQAGFEEKNNKFLWVQEFNIDKNKKDQKEISFKVGDQIKVNIFQEGDKVKVIGKSKGKGFQGVVKRHGFKGASSASHGTKHNLRAPGSIGFTGIQRVVKGKKMAGRMGHEQITLRDIKIIKIIPEKNLLYLKGAIPGRRNTLLKIIG